MRRAKLHTFGTLPPELRNRQALYFACERVIGPGLEHHANGAVRKLEYQFWYVIDSGIVGQ